MKGFCLDFAKTFFLCFVGFALGRLLIFPGFLDLASPTHDDLYRYFLVSQTRWEVGGFFAPRPLMQLFLCGIGTFVRTPSDLWAILSLCSVFFIAALIEFLKKFFTGKIHSLNIVFYATLIFSLPSSWELHQLDYGGMLSGVLCTAALAVFMTRLLQDGNAGIPIFFPFFIFWAAIEMKPTFTILALTVSLLFLFFKRDASSAVVALGVFLCLAFVFLKDKYLIGSAFVSANEGSVYEVKFDLHSNLSALSAYVRASVPYFLLPGLLLVYSTCLLNKRTRLMGLLTPVLALSAIAPMSLIPNRVMTFYSWYSSVFIFMPLLILPVGREDISSAAVKKTTFLALAAIICGTMFFAAKSNRLASHFYALSTYNDNVVKSLNSQINNYAAFMNNERLLISGLQGPYHAFRNRDFVRKQSGLTDYTVMLRNSERAWNEMNISRWGGVVYLDNIDLESYDSFIVYGADGTIKYILSKEELMKIPAHWREAVIFCSSNINYPEASSFGLDEVFSCFANSGEYMAAVRLGKSTGVAEVLNPVALYYFGDALIKTGEYALARTYLNRALSSRPNDTKIKEALKSIEELK